LLEIYPKVVPATSIHAIRIFEPLLQYASIGNRIITLQELRICSKWHWICFFLFFILIFNQY